ncbi:Bax inhibitor-1/YccA family protein [Methanolapillus millepedarum]|uniref:Inner membrane protein YbhL n=1 Tax=Methanolapillus millepedarum TaxID=3028296 RepID=A0AA96V4W1_9EURY|nr:Inner membrane protein YbhL [Methanosarcinaceae archaeon Ac7]
MEQYTQKNQNISGFSVDFGNKFLSKVYMWMILALFLTAIASYAILSTPSLQLFFLGNVWLVWLLMIVQLVFVVILSSKIESMSTSTAAVVFIIYSVLVGITITPVLFYYSQSTIFMAFGVSAGMFAAMSAVGYFIKKDLSAMGRFLFMALVGLLIAMIVNMFISIWWPGTAWGISFALSCLAVLIFAGLTAYDTQKIKKIGEAIAHEPSRGQNIAIICALTLYLDFINLFLNMLRIMGRNS